MKKYVVVLLAIGLAFANFGTSVKQARAEFDLKKALRYYLQNPPKAFQNLNIQLPSGHQDQDCQMENCADAYQALRIYTRTNNLPMQIFPTSHGGLLNCYGFLRSEGTGIVDKLRECASSSPNSEFIGSNECKTPNLSPEDMGRDFRLLESENEVAGLGGTDVYTGEFIPAFDPNRYFVICYSPQRLTEWETACHQNRCNDS